MRRESGEKAPRRLLVSVRWAAAMLVVLALAAPASALHFEWTGWEDADWFNPNNWDLPYTPREEDIIRVSEGPCVADRPIVLDWGGELRLYPSEPGVALDTVVAGDRGAGMVDMDGASDPATIGVLKLGDDAGSEGALFYTGRFSYWPCEPVTDVTRLLNVGAAGGGQVTIEEGCLRTNAAVVGQFFGSDGVVEGDEDAGCGLVCAEDLTVGVYGEGSVQFCEKLSSKVGILGFGEGGAGTVSFSWDLQDPSFETDLLVVGYSGAGTLSFSRGELATGSAIVGGKWELMAGGTGEVNLSCSDWTNAGDLFIGEGGVGTVTAASESTVSSADVYLGYEAEASGTMALSDVSRLVCRNLFLGAYGQGTMTIGFGCETCVAGRAYLGWQAGGDGECVLDGGRLQAAELIVGGAVSDGEMERRDGLLRITQSASSCRVTDRLCFGQCGAIVADYMATVMMDGASLANESTDPSALADLAEVTMIFQTAPDAVATIEAAGEDRGPDVESLDGLFAMHTLTLGSGSTVRLVNATDNNPDAPGAEALYVKRLILRQGATLDLNGLNIHYEQLVDEGGRIIGERIAGDIDGDGVVGIEDFVVLKNNFGADYVYWSDGDLNGDGVVDIADFVILKNNFGRQAGAE